MSLGTPAVILWVLTSQIYLLQPTKRNFVSLVGRICDPLGFLAPTTIKFKILFQKLFYPRSYRTPFSYILCRFCDASIQAYAAVIYLVIESEINTEVKFFVFKTRVAPLWTQIIPRLELLSAFLFSKLVTSVMESLSPNLPQVSLRWYTDFQVALFGFVEPTKSGDRLLTTESLKFTVGSTQIFGATVLVFPTLRTCLLEV